jgi:serine/threonine protein kinase
MTDALNLQRFERDMLNICSGSSMDKIVLALDYGEFEVVHKGVREWVFFIVFEKASGDIRTKAREYRGSGVAWIPRVVHNLAVATSQLHRKDISHNDIKPSNFLVFDMTVQKLADLGRATCASVAGPWDEMPEVGDRTYSAPEAWGYVYSAAMTGSKVHQSYRRAFDIYMLGSLIFFLLTEQSLNRVMATFLRPEYGPSNWRGTFRDIVPYLQSVHADAMKVMTDEIERSYGAAGAKQLSEITDFARNLTQIDPTKRGDPQNQFSGSNLCDLQRLISRSDILARKLSIKEKT